MPTYDLECMSCGTRFERFLTRMLREDDKVCPSCGSTEVKQGVGGGFVARKSSSQSAGGCVSHGGIG